MINVICTTNFDELDTIKESVLKLGYKFKYKPLIEIEFVNLSEESIKQIKESSICIFQSKNAATHTSDHHDLYDKNKDYFAVGGFTAKSVERSIQVNCKHPKNNYSSKNLIEEYDFKNIEGKKIVILKGKGGLNIIRESLYEKNIVHEIETYKRKISSNAIGSDDFDDSSINVIISMSKDALKSICENHYEIIKSSDVVLIVPNKRFISEKVGVFKKVHTLKSLEYSDEIMSIIQNIL